MYENKSHRNKKIALAAALAVAILALAGVGYAATHSFTGETESTTDTVDVEYVTVTLDANSYKTTKDVKLHAVWDTETAGNATTGAATTTWTFQEADVAKYQITVDTSAVETATTTLKASAVNGTIGAYTVKYAYSTENAKPADSAFAPCGSDMTYGGTIPASTASNVIYLWISLTATTADSAPDTTVEIPVITFTATGSD